MTDIVERLLSRPDDINPVLKQDAAAEIQRLRRRVVVLEMVIQEELDEFDCNDEANRMIVEDIHERGASVALPSEQLLGEK